MDKRIYAFEVWVQYDPDRSDRIAMKTGLASTPREMLEKAEKFLLDDYSPDARVVGVKQLAEIEIR